MNKKYNSRFWWFVLDHLPDFFIDEIFYRYYSMHDPKEDGETDDKS